MLTPIATFIWQHASSVRLFPGAHLPVRMTAIRLHDGSLLLHSPSAIDDALAQQLERIGPVNHLVAPNLLHHLHVAAAQRRYPLATLYAPEALPSKNPRIRLDVPLPHAAERLAPDLDCLPLRGAPQLDEWVFHHRASRTLLVTDLVFHVRESQGWLTPWILRGAGTYRRLAVSRILQRLVVDRDAFLESLGPILQLDCERLLMAHGDGIETHAMAALRTAVQERFGAIGSPPEVAARRPPTPTAVPPRPQDRPKSL